jgi:hypothetical protein
MGVTATIRTNLLSIPTRAAPHLVNLDTPQKAEVILRDAVNEVLTALSGGK